MKYFKENYILNNNQHGFRKNRGTQVAIAKLYEIIVVMSLKTLYLTIAI